MLMKRIGKMKQKKGAVLFAVIAVMTLLIAMASTAYYTARSAYNSVVSNYDYSQLYLSATSVSDMVVEAMAYEPAHAAAVHNDFTPLREAVFGTSGTGGTAKPGLSTVNQKVVARSAQISETNANLTGAARDAAIIAELANQESLVAGTVDGIIVEVELIARTYDPDRSDIEDMDSNGDGVLDSNDYNADGTPKKVKTTMGYDYTYVYRTIAYYRNNNVTVEDVVTFEKTFIDELQPGDPGYNSLIPLYKENIISTKGGSSNLNTFFTSTGHVKNQDNKVEVTSHLVKLDTHIITDDSYFQNDHTIIGHTRTNSNKIVGGITSTGSVYLQQANVNITEDDNDWFIGNDLVLTSNANKISLGKENNLYVGDDLILCGDGPSVEAQDIYVQGDLYILGQATFKGNLHVSGNIYYQMPEDHDAVKIVDENKLASLTKNVWDGTEHPIIGAGNPWSIQGGSLYVSGTQELPDIDYNGDGSSDYTSQKISFSDESGKFLYEVDVADGKKLSDAKVGDASVIGTYNDQTMVTITNRVPDETTDRYVAKEETVTVEKAISSKTAVDKENLATSTTDAFTTYDNYTSPAETYKEENTLTIDISLMTAIEVKDGDTTKITGYSYPPGWDESWTSADYAAAGVPDGFYMYAPSDNNALSNAGDLTINIPYNDKKDTEGNSYGWTLEIADTFDDYNGNGKITYNIDSGSDPKKSMPIVLKDNILIDEKTGTATTDSSGVKSFSWRGSGEFAGQAGNNDNATNIVATGTGNVVFEMANINKLADGTTAYGPYNENTTQTVVRYMAGSKEVVGNAAQVGLIEADGYQLSVDQNTGELTGNSAAMMGSNSTPNSGYDNQFMLVSNYNNGTAVDVARQNNVFCGYVYSPNGDLSGIKWVEVNGELKEVDCGQTNPIFGGMIVSTYNSKLSPLVYAEPQVSRISSMISSLYSEDGNNKVDLEKVLEHYDDEVINVDGTEPISADEVQNGDGATLVGSNYVG